MSEQEKKRIKIYDLLNAEIWQKRNFRNNYSVVMVSIKPRP